MIKDVTQIRLSQYDLNIEDSEGVETTSSSNIEQAELEVVEISVRRTCLESDADFVLDLPKHGHPSRLLRAKKVNQEQASQKVNGMIVALNQDEHEKPPPPPEDWL